MTLPVTPHCQQPNLQMTRKICVIKGLIALTVTFLLLQFVGFKIFINKAEEKYDTSPWGTASLFLQACNSLELPVFVVEPSLLRALRGGKESLELWNRRRHHVITFGAIEPSRNEIHILLTKMDSFLHLGIKSPDPRDLSLESKQNYVTVPSHYFMWRPDSGAPMLQLVLFYRVGEDHYWHGAVRPPSSTTSLTVGKHAGSLEKFSIKTEIVQGIQVSYPEDISSFLWKLQHSKFVECDYARARHFFMINNIKLKTMPELPGFRRTARQLLSIVLKTMDSMEVPFWISSGTFLGWYRQCDIIPYSKDVDIGVNIKDYREEMVTAFEAAGLQLVQLFGKVSDSLELSFLYEDVKLDIFFFYEEDDHIWNGGTQAKTGKKFKYSFPKFSLCWTEFLGLRVRVPDPPLPYIKANYGKKWNIPIDKWDWKKSPPNVAENGVWPEKERDEVIQLFEIEKRKKDHKGLKM